MDRDKAFLQRIRKLIKLKLTELEVYVDDELVDYITVLLVNKKTASQMIEDLNLFLNEHSENFVIWLFNTCENFNKQSADSHVENKSSVKHKNKKWKESSSSRDEEKPSKYSAKQKSKQDDKEKDHLPKKRHTSPVLNKPKKRQIKAEAYTNKENTDIKVNYEYKKNAHAENAQNIKGRGYTNEPKCDDIKDNLNQSHITIFDDKIITNGDFIDIRAYEGYDNNLYGNNVESIEEKTEQYFNKASIVRTTELINRLNTTVNDTINMVPNLNTHLIPTIVQSSVMKILHDKKNITSQGLFLKALEDADLRLKLTSNNLVEPSKDRRKMPLTLEEVQQQRLIRFKNEPADSHLSMGNMAETLGLVSFGTRQTVDQDASVAPGLDSARPGAEDVTLNGGNIPTININANRVVGGGGKVMATTTPQFIVTLDPVNPGQGGSNSNELQKRKVVFVGQDRDGSPTLASGKRQRTASLPPAITFDLNDGDRDVSAEDLDLEEANDFQEGRFLERCKFWPACKNGDQCMYHHPIKQCNKFPQCTYGDKCLFIHPNCKFDALCTKKDCPYTHASVRKEQGYHGSAANLPLTSNRPHTPFPVSPGPLNHGKIMAPCKFGALCFNTACPFIHTRECVYGVHCARPNCSFAHSRPSTASNNSNPQAKSKLKWVSPSYRPPTQVLADSEKDKPFYIDASIEAMEKHYY